MRELAFSKHNRVFNFEPLTNAAVEPSLSLNADTLSAWSIAVTLFILSIKIVAASQTRRGKVKYDQ